MSPLLTGDCLEVMAGMEPDSVDAIVTDPPYDLLQASRRGSPRVNVGQPGNPYAGGGARAGGFMGKAWDATGVAFDPQTWTEALRVAKPGAHLLAFGGTRTYHRLACAIEDAGWEIRDCLVWAYASGFPKSLDVSKAIDKAAGATREVVGSKLGRAGYRSGDQMPSSVLDGGADGSLNNGDAKLDVTAPATPDAERWQGWGTALKPAWEPIVMARKPLVGTVAANVLRHGTGALNIDAARIGIPDGHGGGAKGTSGFAAGYEHDGFVASETGRWPANLVLTANPDGSAIFDGDTPGVVGGGTTTSGKMMPTEVRSGDRTVFGSDAAAGYTTIETYGDTGTYSRFFLISKSSRQDREPNAYGRMVGGLEETEDVRVESAHSTVCAKCGRQRVNVPGAACKCAEPEWVRKSQKPRLNSHATVKPLALMRHLVRLVTPPGGRVLDMFAGSGSTLIAAELEGFAWTGIEQEPEYVAIAEARLAGVQRGLGLDVAAPVPKPTKPAGFGVRGSDAGNTMLEPQRALGESGSAVEPGSEP